MEWLKEVESLLVRYPLCDNCLGRQFANLLTNLTNAQRGQALRITLGLHLHNLFKSTAEERQYALRLQKIFTLSRLNCLPSDIQSALTSETHGKTESEVETPKTNQKTDAHLERNIQSQQKMTISSQDVTTNERCRICENWFHREKIAEIVNNIIEKTKTIEFESFLVGTVVKPSIADHEDEIRAEFNLKWGESFKSEFNREIGKRLLWRWKEQAKKTDLLNPDLVILIHMDPEYIELKPNPIFIFGRYQKLVRGIPQAPWHCSACRGKGCEECNFTGKKYDTSVAELILTPLKEIAGATDAKLHASGREDIDARMLGNGRPFIAELKYPQKRKFDLKLAEEKVNSFAAGKVQVTLTAFVTRQDVRELKTLDSQHSKSYRAFVEIQGDIQNIMERKEEIEDFFRKKIISQQTPLRVLHRRADKVRKREVHSIKIEGPVEMEGKQLLSIKIDCEGGLYVKEFISGDSGRTKPSFAEFVGVKARVVALDVIAVHPTNFSARIGE